MIDVLLVILIFLMITTTYNRFSGLKIILPSTSNAPQLAQRPESIEVNVHSDGGIEVNHRIVGAHAVVDLAAALKEAAQGRDEPVILIGADASATHGSVVAVMEAARLAGYHHLTVVTQAVAP
jgi:biopolymer transport protein ExbD